MQAIQPSEKLYQFRTTKDDLFSHAISVICHQSWNYNTASFSERQSPLERTRRQLGQACSAAAWFNNNFVVICGMHLNELVFQTSQMMSRSLQNKHQ
jgi:hypothetical protein